MKNLRTQVCNAVEKIEGVDYNSPATPETIKDNIENTGLRIKD